MIFSQKPCAQVALRQAITKAYRQDENQVVEQCLQQATLPAEALQRIDHVARTLVTHIRAKNVHKAGLDAFLSQYDLSNVEGIALMCLAEALLRVPDKTTADRLIKDKILSATWETHAGKSDSLFVNATTWGLMLTGTLFSWDELQARNLASSLKKLALRSGEPLIRKSVNYAMKILGRQFVMGRTMREALKRSEKNLARGYRYSYDMLGEAARTAEDAERYFQEYHAAITEAGKAANGLGPILSPGISVKLSALHPRYELAQRDAVMQELLPKLYELALQAKKYNINLTVDAEEADRLDLSLDILEPIFMDPIFANWEGLGLAVQAYQKRALPVIDWLADCAKKAKKRWMIRLIKGAYWDSEIKHSQELGLENYPVFTRKASTDVSYIACIQRILAHRNAFYPQFATHNAYSVAAVLELMGEDRDFEFQCLHGMGRTLYDEIVDKTHYNHPCRIYAPVGSHEDLLPYLVRRLLENGANSSFVNRIVDEKAPIESLIQDPVATIAGLGSKPHPKIPLPSALYGVTRVNAEGLDLSNHDTLTELADAMEKAAATPWRTASLGKGVAQSVTDPSHHQRVVGLVTLATDAVVEQAILQAVNAKEAWAARTIDQRAACLLKAADLFEQHRTTFMAMAVREAGKTIPDALGEVREAVDFCRYYAVQARQALRPVTLPGPTGESNCLHYRGRGIIVSISPWNFPLAIFTGQVVAALVAGNVVLAKPAEQTPLIADFAVKLLHEAGIPKDVLQLLPGDGATVGAHLVASQQIDGVMFTGSTETARLINQTLAKRHGSIVPLIAETGGQNAMIVDSSALPEQVVKDALISAFGSAGQRCSALRVLFLQNDVAPRIIDMLKGAMQELRVGDPSLLSTDVGPVIDVEAQTNLQSHIDHMIARHKVIYQVKLPQSCEQGTFIAPIAIELDSLADLEREVFGPVLHVIRYRAKDLDKIIASINQTGYGLTLGVHSRINEVVEYIQQRVKAGNVYVNRSMIGAVVGVQPFGGEGLSGTGPKAGGPHYLQRLCVERTISINTTAAGGNATLMSLSEED
jgi:RHH-type transcriptional regulator, proline utilization regulon repressor / proline dehydrogenase / delta 1-pyrroline-5-carboxylate dehydrogenase